MKKWLIEKLGGYPTLDSAIEAIRDTEDTKRKNRILTLAVKKLFAIIGPDDILREVNGQLLYEGRPLSKSEVDHLKAEAEVLQNLKIWKVLRKELSYHSLYKVWLEAKGVEDLTAGKILRYYIDIVDTRLKSLSK